MTISDHEAVALLRGLVEIPSVSGNELAASLWLTDQMNKLGFDHAYVDEANNAVGRVGNPEAAHTVVLLGHIDTVPGEIPVQVKTVGGESLMFGRGTVDAKGPLATFAVGAANLKPNIPDHCQVVVVGAVEEEAATSKGARVIRDRYNGLTHPVPDYCLIGEPSGASGIARGYKGRILIRLHAWQTTAHSAGEVAEIAELGVSLWTHVQDLIGYDPEFEGRIFDQASPSLREFNTDLWVDGQNHVRCLIGIRLPQDFDATHFVRELVGWCKEHMGPTQPTVPQQLDPDTAIEFACTGPLVQAHLAVSGFEPAWLTPRDNHLATSLQRAIRQVTGRKPRYMVKTGTCDMNVVGPAWGCPVFAYGPGNSDLDHTPNEHVAIAEYLQANQVLTSALQTLVKTF